MEAPTTRQSEDGSNGKPERSVLERVFDWLRRNGYRSSHREDQHFREMLDELSNSENGAKGYDIDPFIQPEYPQVPDERKNSPDPSDGNNKKYRKPPYEYLDTDWHLGWTDGRCGQSQTVNSEIIKARVQVEAEQELHGVQSEIAAKETRIAGLNDLLERRKPRLRKQEDLHDRLSEKRNKNFLEFSRPLGYVYLLFAILLFLADIPLSLKLVASGFQVPVEADLPPDVSRIGSSPKLLIDHLLFHPWYVFGMFWESMALAAGIAFLGIIVKYYVDLIVLRDSETKRPGWLPISVLTLILFGFGATTFFLGNFRAEQQSQAVRREIETNLRKENSENLTFNQRYPNASRVVFQENDIDGEVTKRFNQKQALTGSKWLTQTFIALTLLLPVVGGVCFSASGIRLRNAKQCRLAFSDYKKIEAECDMLSLRSKKEEGELQGLRDKLKIIEKDPDRLKSREALKLSLYLHGYARGRTVPETLEEGASLYDRCEKTVIKLLAQKSREKTSSA